MATEEERIKDTVRLKMPDIKTYDLSLNRADLRTIAWMITYSRIKVKDSPRVGEHAFAEVTATLADIDILEAAIRPQFIAAGIYSK